MSCPAADLFNYFFLVLFFPFLPRLFLRILMLQVRFQLTFAMYGLLRDERVSYTKPAIESPGSGRALGDRMGRGGGPQSPARLDKWRLMRL